jgi:dTDP-4-amino-4,6-dideoxygalactose transaminase
MTPHRKIPLFDLHAQYLSLKPELDDAMAAVIRDSAYIRGPFVEKFEKEFALTTGAAECISCSDGTAAIYIVLKMLGIGPGDEVITTANSWIATTETITQAGATVVFADVEKDYYNLDPDKVEAAITPRTKAVIAVHLLGQPADMDRLQEICRRHNLHLIEDCAQAHLAEYRGKQIGSFGVAATFSFYPGKNLGAYGDAGGIITNDAALADKCRCFARHGSSPKDKHDHIMEGINSRLDGMQAAILSVKLPHLKNWNRRRNEVAVAYAERLKDVPGLTLPAVRPECAHVFHVFALRLANRDQVRNALNGAGVSTTVHYPRPLPFLQAYEYRGYTRESLPVIAGHEKEYLSVPIYPELTSTDIDYVAEIIRGSA